MGAAPAAWARDLDAVPSDARSNHRFERVV